MAKTKTKNPKKKNHLTEVLNAITLKQPCEYEPKEFSAFVLSLFLSEDPNIIKYVNEINKYQFSLPDELIFKYYVNIIPKGKRYLKFTKKTKVAKDKEKLINELVEMYGISKREAALSLTEK